MKSKQVMEDLMPIASFCILSISNVVKVFYLSKLVYDENRALTAAESAEGNAGCRMDDKKHKVSS